MSSQKLLEVVESLRLNSLLEIAKTSRFWINLISAYGTYKIIYYLFFDPLRHIPGLWWSRFTEFPLLIRRFNGTQEQYTLQLHKRFGSVVRVGPHSVSVKKVVDIRRVLSSYKYPKAEIYDKALLDAEEIFSTRDEQFNRLRRRQVGPAFSTTGLDSVEDIVLDVGSRAFKKKIETGIEKGNGSYTINYFDNFQSLTADIIGELAFGKSFGALESEKPSIIRLVNSTIIISVLDTLIPPVKYIPFLFSKYKSDKQKMVDFTSSCIDARREAIEKNEFDKGRIDILQMYLNAHDLDGSPITKDELIAEIVLMLVAGTDTTSVTMTWLLHFYLMYPEVYKKVVAEIDEAFPDRSAIIRYKEARQNLPYFHATVYECMRMKPAVGGYLPRDSSSDGIQLSDHYIPPSTELLLFIEGAHNDESVWTSPKKYIPERFMGESGKELAKNLVVFASGVRICAGRK
ncbi:hypothetical protein BB560_002689 [Smittium megazygosporum]|uniref:F-box domain-containing protein n=1 Tax=Smittium megazygosporum TaxID=133381 RepID=A0A2T9ZE83_9FUNG|nr:hypothetical protein BB560_002689 [Smittium megazygosporum]